LLREQLGERLLPFVLQPYSGGERGAAGGNDGKDYAPNSRVPKISAAWPGGSRVFPRRDYRFFAACVLERAMTGTISGRSIGRVKICLPGFSA